jgi:outer membrane lipoprotein SlyB
MRTKKIKKTRSASATAAIHRIQHEAEGGAFGAIGGAVVGAGAGLPGAIAGAVVGGIAGALAGAAVDSDGTDRDARTRELDAEIGVTEGDLGAPNLAHPRSRDGT